MKMSLAFAAAFAVSTMALAADAPMIKTRTIVKTSDGVRVGFIDRVNKGADGAPIDVQIIYKGHLISIPASTLTGADKGLVTSLTKAEVNRL